MKQNELLKTRQILMDEAKGIVESGAAAIPICFAFTKKGDMVMLPLNNVPKAMWPMVVTGLLRASNAEAYIFVSEAYMASGGKELRDKLESGVIENIIDLPKDDREDALFVVARLRKGKPLIAYAYIWDTPQGRRVQECRYFDSKAEGIEGRLFFEFG